MEESKLDPLQIEPVLRVLFQQFNADELKNVRLVCKQWRDLSLKRWRTIATVFLKGDVRDTYSFNIKKGLPIKELRNLWEVEDDTLHQLKKEPFASFKLVNLSCGTVEGQTYSQEDLQWFYVTLGPYIKCLKLVESECSCDAGPFPLVFSNVRNLERLTLHRAYMYCSKEKPWSYGPSLEKLKFLELGGTIKYGERFSWEKLLKCMPSIECLKIDLYPNFLYGEFKAIFSSAQSLRLKKVHILPLGRYVSRFEIKHLNLHEGDLAFFRECPFPLQKLTMDLGMDSTPNVVARFLEPFATTLEYLRLYARNHHFPSTFDETEPSLEMSKLKELRFINGLPWGFRVLRRFQLPKLEKLVVESMEHDSLARMRSGRLDNDSKLHYRDFQDKERLPVLLEGIRFMKLEHFEFHTVSYTFSQKEMESLSKAMPNLKYLVIPSGNVEMVPEFWPGLVSLDFAIEEPDID